MQRAAKGRPLESSGRRSRNVPLMAVIGSIITLLFVLDLAFPLGVASGVPYVLAVLLSLWLPERRWIVGISCLASLLTVVGFFIPFPVGEGFWIGLVNRFIALFAIGVTAYLGVRALRQAEHVYDRETRMQAILDAAADAIITVDERGAIESSNRAAVGIFRCDAHLNGTSFRGLFAEEENELDQLAPLFQHDVLPDGEQRFAREVRARRQDGSCFPMDVSLSSVKLGRGRVYVGILRDITERKEFQQRLFQAERLAAIGQTMTALAHESRNALQRSQICIQLLRHQFAAEPQALELVDTIQLAQDELHLLYEQVRQYAAPVNLTMQLCALDEVVQNAWDDLRPRHEQREAVLRIRPNPDLTRLSADSFALRQVFRNILENALSACVDPVEIGVRFQETELAGKPAVMVAVRDNGPGIPPDARTAVFQPFYTTKSQGTGLGLAICLRIVQAHGGDVGIADDCPQGTEFQVILPTRLR